MAETEEEERGLELAGWGTRFTRAETEAKYRKWQVAMALPFNRAGLLASVGQWAAITGVIFVTLPTGFIPWAAAIVFGMMPILCGALMTTYRPSLRRWVQPSVMIANSVAGILAVSMLNWHVKMPEASLAAALIINYFGLAILRVRPGLAACAVLPYLFLEQGFLVAALAGPKLIIYTFGNASGFLTGMLAAVVLDVVSREGFRQERIVEAQKKIIASERARSELILKHELGHQVAARSRELGQMLAKIDASFVVGRLSLGERFDSRYRVERELGAGGMGAVYEVERITDGERLALKIVMGQVSGAQAARFAREAEIGAGIRHPNLIAIVDVGIAEGVPFLAMDLARGGSLEEQRERFGDAVWALPILRGVAAGLRALHAKGIVHRDLKPANVLFGPDDESAVVPKISDFGISRFGALDLESDADPVAATVGVAQAIPQALTATGMLLGTPYYMAPEGARGGRNVDLPADIFAFGILAFEMLTGRAPFSTPSVYLAMAGQPLPEPHPLLDEHLNGPLREALLACLSEDPDRRPSIKAICSALAGRDEPC